MTEQERLVVKNGAIMDQIWAIVNKYNERITNVSFGAHEDDQVFIRMICAVINGELSYREQKNRIELEQQE